MPLKTSFGLITKVGGRVIAAMASKKMLVWALRLSAKRTKTQIDDRVVDVVDAALHGSVSDIRQAAKALADTVFREFDNKKAP